MLLLTAIVLCVSSILLSIEVRYRAKEKNILNETPKISDRYYYYNQLTAKEQLLFESIKKAADSYEAQSEIVPYRYSAEEMAKVNHAFILDATEFFYIDVDGIKIYCDDYKTKTELKYINSATNIQKMKMEIEAVSAAAEAYTKNTGSDFEKAVILHDFLADHCTKETDTKNPSRASNTAYGALVEKTAFGNGYAAAYKELLRRCGIESVIIEGTSNSNPHTWNAVKLGGSYYHVDVTWDDPDIDFLSELAFHGYFALSDKAISKDHTIGKDFTVPVCDSETDYYAQNGGLITSESEITEKAYLLLKKAVEADRQYIEISPVFSKNEDDYKEQLLLAIDKLNSELQTPKLSRSFRAFPATSVGSGVTIQIYYI